MRTVLITLLILLLCSALAWSATITMGSTGSSTPAHCAGDSGCELYGDSGDCNSDPLNYGTCTWIPETPPPSSVITLGGGQTVTIGN